jgi:predicted enzyme related to lactoylglutathione lyase
MKFELSPFIAIQVKDHEKAIKFYQKTLGMKFKYNKDNDTYLEKDGTNFVFENAPKGHSVFFEFKVDNLEEARKLLESEGCIVTRDYSSKNAMFSDPYGMNFHIFEEGAFENNT